MAGVAARYIQRLIDAYVDHSAGLSRIHNEEGALRLDHVHLKCSLLEKLLIEKAGLSTLPAEFRVAYCKKLRLKVPWTLWSGGVIDVHVDELLLLVTHRFEGAELAKIAVDAKEAKIKAVMQELVKHREGPRAATGRFNKSRGSARAAGKSSLGERILLGVLKRFKLRVCVENVHLRFEDLEEAVLPFAAGITLGRLELTQRESIRQQTQRAGSVALGTLDLSLRDLGFYLQQGSEISTARAGPPLN